MSAAAHEMQRLHEALLKNPRRTARDRNVRVLCACGNRVTRNQLKKHEGKCIYCGQEVRS